MPEEELNKEEVSEETPPDESSEEAKPEEGETEKEPSKEIPKGYWRGADGLLYSDEFPEKRFEGINKAWQKDHRDTLDLKKEIEGIKEAQKPQPNAEDQWVDYIYDKIKGRERLKQEQEDKVVQSELEQVSAANPDLNPDKILETAIKYKVNLFTAANFLKDIQATGKVKINLTQEELNRKKAAGKIAGKPSGAGQKAGLTVYDKEKDKGKRPEELMEEGLKELGVK